MTDKLSLVGLRCGRLLVLAFARKIKTAASMHYAWKCLCDCGTEVEIDGYRLKTGGTTSCGCALSELIVAMKTKHGHSPKSGGSVEYSTWSTMKQRCQDVSSKSYPRYGGAGVTVCARWADFSNFLADMGLRPTAEHSIDRFPDAAGNYEPGNCRWATRSEQARNKKTSLRVMVGDESVQLSDACERASQPYQRVFQRIYKLGWTPERALSSGNQRAPR